MSQRMHKFVDDPLICVDLPVAIAPGIAVAHRVEAAHVESAAAKTLRSRTKRKVIKTGDWTVFLLRHPTCHYKDHDCTERATVVCSRDCDDGRTRPTASCATCAGIGGGA